MINNTTDSSSSVSQIPGPEAPPSPKKKTMLYVTIVVSLLIIVGGSVLVFTRKNSDNVLQESDDDISLPEADPNIKINLKPKDAGKSVMLTIKNLPPNTTSVEYELTYKTVDNKSEGVFGIIKLSSKETSVERELVLGTCSSGVCRYHQVTGDGKLTIKFIDTKGASRFQKEYPLI